MISPTEHYDETSRADPGGGGKADRRGDRRPSPPRGPPFAHLVSAVDTVNPELMDAVSHRGYRMFED